MDSPSLPILATSIGLVSSTIFFTMNHTINYLTIPTILLGSPPASSNESSSKFLIPATSAPETQTNHLNRQWQEIYWRGHRIGLPTALISGVAYAAAAYYEPRMLNKELLAAASAMSFAIPPYTVIWMVPTNNRLHARGDALSAGKEEKLESEETAFGLLEKWVGCSKIRANLAVVAFAVGVAGLLVK